MSRLSCKASYIKPTSSPHRLLRKPLTRRLLPERGGQKVLHEMIQDNDIAEDRIERALHI
jgi:hypothetical protein